LNLDLTPACHNHHKLNIGGKTVKKLMVISFLILSWANTAFAAGGQYHLQVAGLACPFCAYGIEKKLNSIKGVEDIKVDVASGMVIVTMAEGVKLTEEIAREKVKKAGFSLHSFTEQE
jgi:mercuric ion binding protein